MVLENYARYERIARLHLFILDFIVAALPILFVLLFLAGILWAAFPNHSLLFDILAIALVLTIAAVRLRSFHSVFRDTMNVMVSQTRKPSYGGTAVFVILGIVIVEVVKIIVYAVPDLLPWAVLTFGGGLFYVLRLHHFLKATVRFFTVVPLGEGVMADQEVSTDILHEANTLADTFKGDIQIQHLFLANSIDIGVGRISSEEDKVYSKSIAVGLPLLQSVTPAQFRALLQSEYSLLSTPTGRLFYRYVGRLAAWRRLLASLSSARHWGAGLFTLLNASLASRLTAHLFLLSRLAYQEGDGAVVKSGFLEPLRDALANLSYKHRIIEQSIWPDLYRKADDTGATALDPFSVIHGQLSDAHDHEQAKLTLNEAMSPVENLPLIPGPSERLAMLNVPTIVPEEQEAAASHYFGDTLESVIEHVNRSWNRTFSDTYGETLIRRRQMRADMDAIMKEADEISDRPKEAELLLQAGQIVEELVLDEAEWEEALELYRRAIFADPDSAPARLAAARLLLARGEDEGLDLLHTVLQSSEYGESHVYAYEIAERYLKESGMLAEAKQLEEQYGESWKIARRTFNAEQLAAEEERASLQPTDALLSHELSEKDLNALRRVLERHSLVRGAWLVRKDVLHFKEFPFYILGVDLKRLWSWTLLDPGGEIAYAQQIAEELSFLHGGYVLLLLDKGNRISSMVRGFPGSHVYPAREVEGEEVVKEGP